MRQQYRAEFFTPGGIFKSASPVAVTSLENDYLALDKSTISTQVVNVSEGDICHIVDACGNAIYQGIVADFQDEKYRRDISLIPLNSILNVQVYQSIASINSDVESWIENAIKSKYVTTSDVLQRMPITVTTLTHTLGNINIEGNAVELYDVVRQALEQLGIFVKVVFVPSDGILSITIAKVTNTGNVIEADTMAILEKTIVIGGGTASYNKATLYKKDAESTHITYYLHSDGSISTSNTDRISPVHEYIAIVDAGSDTFEDVALKTATEKLVIADLQNYFELTVSNDSKIIPGRIEIGQAFTIIHNGIGFNSILTNLIVSGDTITLVFGVVRLELTKRLSMNERK